MAALVPELAAEAAPEILSGLEAGVGALKGAVGLGASAGVAAAGFTFNEVSEGAERLAKTYREIVGEPEVEVNTGPRIEEFGGPKWDTRITPKPMSLNALYPVKPPQQQMPNPPSSTAPLSYASPAIPTQSTSEPSQPALTPALSLP
jgi:hypothetical protein